ncbi:MAG: AbrB/MazE/SpoVT family DNA-binding domain-containing protein [Candidatus Bathyarchaeia archaeon]
MRAGQTEIIKMDSKGRVSIPKVLREQLCLNRGMELEISEDKGRIVLTPLTEDPVETIFEVLSQTLPEGRTATEVQRELRGEWNRGLDKEVSRICGAED